MAALSRSRRGCQQVNGIERRRVASPTGRADRKMASPLHTPVGTMIDGPVKRRLVSAASAALLVLAAPQLAWAHGEGALVILMGIPLVVALAGSVVGCLMTRRWIARASVVVSSIVAWVVSWYALGLFDQAGGLALFLGLPLVAPLVVAMLFRVRDRARDPHRLRG
jgi:hypothetical protein